MGFWRWFFRTCPDYKEVGNLRIFCIEREGHYVEHLGRHEWRYYRWK